MMQKLLITLSSILILGLTFLVVIPATALESQTSVQADYQFEQSFQEVTIYWPGLWNIEQLTLDKVNETRREHGLTDTTWNDALWRTTRGHSQDMAENNYFEHRNLDNEGPLARAWPTWDQTGCSRSIGENLALIWVHERDVTEHRITDTATGIVYVIKIFDYDYVVDTAVRLWLESESHRDNMLRDYWTTTGVGARVGQYDVGWYPIYITQNFCV